MERNETIIEIEDFAIYADYEEQAYKLWFEGLVFYSNPQNVISDFMSIKDSAMDTLEECEANIEMFYANTPATGILGIGEFRSFGSVLYYLDEIEPFTSGSVYSVFQRFSDEVNRLGREYL